MQSIFIFWWFNNNLPNDRTKTSLSSLKSIASPPNCWSLFPYTFHASHSFNELDLIHNYFSSKEKVKTSFNHQNSKFYKIVERDGGRGE